MENHRCPIRPLDDRVVVVRDDPITEHASGLALVNPDEALTGVVVNVGPGRHTEHGALIQPPVHIGDRVRFAEVGGTAVELDGEEWLVLPPLALLGVYRDDPPKLAAVE